MCLFRDPGRPTKVNAILEAKRKEVLSERGLEEAEEDTVLAQLGILPVNGGSAQQAEPDMKETPMVAEVVEANTTPKDSGHEGKETIVANGNAIDVDVLEVSWPRYEPV